MDQKQQEALKRKFEQAMEQTRRSLEAVESHRKNLIDNELILMYSALDLKNLINSLVNDQEILFKYLCDLKSIKDKTAATNEHIKQIEDDLETRSAQIIELSSKQEDLDGKMKKFSESFKTIPELRTAIDHLLHKLLDSRSEFKKQLAKAEDRIEQLTTENSDLKKRRSKNEVHKETTKTPSKKRINDNNSYTENQANDTGSSKSSDDFKDPDYSPSSKALNNSFKKTKISCRCKTNCLKRFCICKRNKSFCTDCDCINCLNIPGVILSSAKSKTKKNDETEVQAEESAESKESTEELNA